MKYILFLLLLATICLGLWFVEVLIRDWIGLEWLNYFHFAIFIIPLIIFLWIVWINGKLEFEKHFIYYPLLSITYSIYMLILVSSYPSHFYYNPMVRGAASSGLIHYLPLILFPFVTFLWNKWVARIENKKLSLFNKLVLLLSAFSIPVISTLITVLLFTQSYLFPQSPPNPIENGFEPIHWLKSGSLIFAIIIYEGIYFLWLKEKIQFSNNIPIFPNEQPEKTIYSDGTNEQSFSYE